MVAKKIAVIGSGSWGTAIAIMLAKNKHKVKLWSWQKKESEELAKNKENKLFLPGIIIPNEISFFYNIEKCIKDTDLVVMAVPSHAEREIAKRLNPIIEKGKIIVNLSKGLEDGSLLRLSQVIQEEIPQALIAVMSGPSHAEEVARDVPTTNVVASNNKEAVKFIQDVFMNINFRVYTSFDVIGVELGGALKNVIALCAGICDGLKFGDNTKAALMTRGIAEMARLGLTLGAKIETFAGLSGIGDLIVTCTSMHSRNRRAGILIGQGRNLQETLEEVHMVVEGVNTTKAAYQLANKHSVEMPIVNEAYNVLFKNKDPKEAVMDLMMRDKKHEMEIL